MITLENISSGDVYEGKDLEYFVDDDTYIGEVYLDGNLIFQSLDVMNDNQLEHAFKLEYKMTQQEQDIFSNLS
jgi:hypothetical protein